MDDRMSVVDSIVYAYEADLPSSLTFEEEAMQAMRNFHGRPDPCPDARENYTMMFLADYDRALNWKHTDHHTFLDAYAHRALAVLNGADERDLDRMAYQLRQDWTCRTRRAFKQP